MPRKVAGEGGHSRGKDDNGKGADPVAKSGAKTRPSMWRSGTLPTSHADLSPTAVKLLEAARTLLERSGYEGLRLEAISAESGLAHSLIRYHFGGKAGLVGALIDWCFHETYMEMHKDFSNLVGDDVEAGVHALSAGLRRLFDSPVSYRLYLDLSVACLHDDNIRAKLADSFEGQRALIMESMREPPGSVSDGRAYTIASIACAFADGLAIQYLADPSRVDLDRVLDLWDQMLEGVLRPKALGDGDRDAGGGRDAVHAQADDQMR
jgi:AcrR family transcriptional regulator